MARTTYQTREQFFGTKTELTDLGTDLASDMESAQTFIPLDITALREIATNDIQNRAACGGFLALDSTPTLKRVNVATDRALRVTWVAGNVDEVQFPPVSWPPDLDPSADVVVHLLVARSASTDDCQIDVQAFEGVGDTEMGEKTQALTTTDLTEVTATLAAANITGHPGFLNLSLVPDAHTTDDLYLYAAWIEYTRKLRTS